MPPEDKEENTNKNKNSFSSERSIEEHHKQDISSDRTKEDSNDYVNQSVRGMEKFNGADKIQIGMLILNLFTLIAFIWISSVQISKTNDALKIADTSNAITREALEFTKKTTLSSDSSTKQALKISDSTLFLSDSSLKIAYQNFKISKEVNKMELRAYIQVLDATIDRWKLGGMINSTLEYTNLGKTPGYNVKIRANIKVGGTGIYDVDWDSTKLQYWGGNNIIGSNITFKTVGYYDRILTKRDSIEIVNGKEIFALYGFIDYEDIFGDAHFTRFCLKFDARENKLLLYRDYNEANRNSF